MKRMASDTPARRVPSEFECALPTPIYHCPGCGHSYDKTADKMYWVDEQPTMSPGWYCHECVDKISGTSRHDRLNMEIFLIMLDSDLGAD